MNESTESNSTLLSTATENKIFGPLWTTAYSLNLILGLPANVYVLWSVMTAEEGMMSSEIFSLNLTVCEILFCLGSLLDMTSIYLSENSNIILTVVWFMFGFIFAGRPLFQCCICVERYLAVVHPVTFMRYKPLRYRLGCCGLVWLIVLGSCFEYFLLKDFDSARFYCIFSFTLVVFSVMLFCCLAVLRALKHPGPGDREREGTNHFKMRAFRIILKILTAMFLSNLPLIIFTPIQQFMDADYLNLTTSIITMLIVVSGFVQPLLFLHRIGKLPCVSGP